MYRKNQLDIREKIRYHKNMINEKDKKLEETISAVLEDFASYSTNISSEIARKMIAKQIVKKINKMYELNIKYYYK